MPKSGMSLLGEGRTADVETQLTAYHRLLLVRDCVLQPSVGARSDNILCGAQVSKLRPDRTQDAASLYLSDHQVLGGLLNVRPTSQHTVRTRARHALPVTTVLCVW